MALLYGLSAIAVALGEHALQANHLSVPLLRGSLQRVVVLERRAHTSRMKRVRGVEQLPRRAEVSDVAANCAADWTLCLPIQVPIYLVELL